MPDSKITALTALTAADPANDMFPVVDVSDTTMAASGTTKRISINNILACSPSATLASATITGALTVSAGTVNGVGYLNASKVLTAGSALVFDGTNLGIGGTGQLRFTTSGGAIGDNTIGTENSFSMMLRCGRGSTSNIELALDKLVFSTSASERYRIASDGVATWSNVGGTSGTAMTLNANGLGVGVASPDQKFCVLVADSAQAASFRAASGRIRIRPYINAAYGSAIQATNVAESALQLLTLEGLSINLNTNSGTALTLDASGNCGLGVTPSLWNSNYNGLDIGQNGCIAGRVGSSNTIDIISNGFRNSAGNYVYKLATSNTACRYQLDGSTGSHIWYSGAAGTAGNTIAGFSTALMTLDASGNLILQSPSSPPTLATNGQLTVNATSNTNLRFSYRGSDGTTRVANITLA